MRYSRQRELVLRQVQNRCDHPTADDIYLAIREDCPGLSLGTVYRNLNGLVEMRIVLTAPFRSMITFTAPAAERSRMFSWTKR